VVNAWKVVLATLVIFIAGIFTGVVLTRHNAPRWPQRPPSQPGTARAPATFSPGGIRVEFLRRAQRELDLTKEQKEKIDLMIKHSQERSRKIMEPVAPELRREIQRSKDELMEVLTPDQRKRFTELMAHTQHPRDQRKKEGSGAATGTNAPAER
jgi:Spy/CpxP family protein refolding chaperone